MLRVQNQLQETQIHQNYLYPQFTYEKGFHSPEDTKSIRDLFWPPGPKNLLFETRIFQKYENYGHFSFRLRISEYTGR